jgi:hypothetical protein
MFLENELQITISPIALLSKDAILKLRLLMDFLMLQVQQAVVLFIFIHT